MDEKFLSSNKIFYLYTMLHQSFYRSFTASSLWKPELHFTSPVVNRRRYRVQHVDGKLTIERTWNDFFDFSGLAQAKRWYINVQGSITWVGETAELRLRVGLAYFPIVINLAVLAFVLVVLIMDSRVSWKADLLIGLVMVISLLVGRAYFKFVIQCFVEDLTYDIERFRVDESTRWH